MSGVVLRCPNCGTTKAVPGECEACHEAQVRYFCTNHTPGRWLDARACPQCGAQFGEPARPRATPRPAAPERVPAPSPAPTAAPRSAGSPPGPTAGDERWGRGERVPTREEALEARDERVAARLRAVRNMHERLRSAARTRPAPGDPTHLPDGSRVGLGLGGCLMRLVLLVAFLFITFMTGIFVLGGSLLPFFRLF